MMPAQAVVPKAQPIAEPSPAIESAPFDFLDQQQETSPPLPHKDDSEQSTVNQGASQYVTSAKNFLGAITSGVKATAQIAAKKAQQTKLTTVDLPHAYLALGREVNKERRHQDDFQEQFAEIDRLVAQMTTLKQAKPAVQGQTLTDKAKSAAGDAKSAATAKALEFKINGLIRHLGQAAHDRFGADSGSQDLVQSVERLKGQISEIASEITKIGQTYQQNLKKKKIGLVPVIIGGAVIAILGIWIIGAMVGRASKTGSSSTTQSNTAPSIEKKLSMADGDVDADALCEKLGNHGRFVKWITPDGGVDPKDTPWDALSGTGVRVSAGVRKPRTPSGKEPVTISVYVVRHEQNGKVWKVGVSSPIDVNDTDAAADIMSEMRDIVCEFCLLNVGLEEFLKQKDTALKILGKGATKQFGKATFSAVLNNGTLIYSVTQTVSSHRAEGQDAQLEQSRNESVANNEPPHEEIAKSTTPDGIIEWQDDNSVLCLCSDKLIPVLYGVPNGVISELPPDELDLIRRSEQLAKEASSLVSEQAANPILQQRVTDTIRKKALAVAPPNQPSSIHEMPLKGWVGWIRLASDAAIIHIGQRSIINDFTFERGLAAPRPRTNYITTPNEPLIMIELKTQYMSDAAIGQFKGIKNGDWVKVDVPDVQWQPSEIVRLGSKRGQPKVFYGTFALRETGYDLYSKHRKAEPKVTKLADGP
jgi:hypothetical protein